MTREFRAPVATIRKERKEPAGERSTRKVECKPFGYKTGSPT